MTTLLFGNTYQVKFPHTFTRFTRLESDNKLAGLAG